MKPRYLVPDDLLGRGEVCALLDVSYTTLKRWRDAGAFPDPFTTLTTGPVWIRVDVERWQADHPRRTDAAQVEHWRRTLQAP